MAKYQVYAYLNGEENFKTFQGQAGTGAEAFFKGSRREKRLFLVNMAKEVRDGRPFTASLSDQPWTRFAHTHMENDFVLAYDAQQVRAALFRFDPVPEAVTKQAAKFTTTEQLCKAITAVFNKYFPKCYITARLHKSLGGVSIKVEFTLYQKWNYGIKRNDPLYHDWFVKGFFQEDGVIVNDKALVELISGGSLMTTENEGFLRRTINLRHRNQKTVIDRVPAFFDRYLKRVKKVVVDNQSIIPVPD